MFFVILSSSFQAAVCSRGYFSGKIGFNWLFDAKNCSSDIMIGSLPKPVSRAAVCGALNTVGPFLDHHCIISGRK